MEIERKFLVDKDSLPDISALRTSTIIQGYISKDPEIRIRQKVEENSSSYFLTIKSTGDLEREEFEIEITRDLFERLFTNIISELIHKDRYYMEIMNEDKYKSNTKLTIEIDIFKGKYSDLITAEVEFDNRKDADTFIPLNWFGKEITYEKTYKNKYLAFDK